MAQGVGQALLLPVPAKIPVPRAVPLPIGPHPSVDAAKSLLLHPSGAVWRDIWPEPLKIHPEGLLYMGPLTLSNGTGG